LLLTSKLLNQWFLVVKLKSSNKQAAEPMIPSGQVEVS